MASTHIEIQGTAGRLSADTRRMVDSLRAQQDLFVKVKDIMDQVAAGTDWATLATYLGTSAADAETAYNLITAGLADITSANINNILDQLG